MAREPAAAAMQLSPLPFFLILLLSSLLLLLPSEGERMKLSLILPHSSPPLLSSTFSFFFSASAAFLEGRHSLPRIVHWRKLERKRKRRERGEAAIAFPALLQLLERLLGGPGFPLSCLWPPRGKSRPMHLAGVCTPTAHHSLSIMQKGGEEHPLLSHLSHMAYFAH